MSSDLISIIVPVYNVEQYILRCLDSILNQTYKNWELFVVNDGSTDKSGEICRKYAEKDKRITYLEQRNQGQSVARNKALDIARGNYICFVDSDDWVEPTYLEDLYSCIKQNDSDLAMCSYYISSKNVDIVGVNYISNELIPSDFKSKIIKNEIKSFLWDKIFNKRIFNNIRFKNGVSFEDILIFHKILTKIKTNIPILKLPLYHYFQRPTSTSKYANLKREKDYFNALKSGYELDWITKEEKAYCLKYLLIGFYYFYQVKDFNYEIVNDCKNYINKIPKYMFTKAKRLLSKKELTRFLLAFYFPKIYRLIYKIYKFITQLSHFKIPNKS